MLTIKELQILLTICLNHREIVEMVVEMHCNDTHEDKPITQLQEIERKLELMMQIQGSG
jgi:hypothetical protein